jgi:hypothetical protein
VSSDQVQVVHRADAQRAVNETAAAWSEHAEGLKAQVADLERRLLAETGQRLAAYNRGLADGRAAADKSAARVRRLSDQKLVELLSKSFDGRAGEIARAVEAAADAAAREAGEKAELHATMLDARHADEHVAVALGEDDPTPLRAVEEVLGKAEVLREHKRLGGR